MGYYVFVVLFILAGVGICVNAIVGWIPPEHPQLAGRDPDQPNEPLWSRFLATFDPKFQKDWAAGRKVMRTGGARGYIEAFERSKGVAKKTKA